MQVTIEGDYSLIGVILHHAKRSLRSEKELTASEQSALLGIPELEYQIHQQMAAHTPDFWSGDNRGALPFEENGIMGDAR